MKYVYNLVYEMDMYCNGTYEDQNSDSVTVVAKTHEEAINKVKKAVMKPFSWREDETREKMLTTYKSFRIVELKRTSSVDY